MTDDKNPNLPPDGILPGMPPTSQPPLQDQIILKPHARTPALQPAPPPPKQSNSASEPKDGTREIIETVVFVVVLVLLLKTFLAEAFVIPTGSMATTLLGYHIDVNCDKCGYRFLVNASSEAEPQDGMQRNFITECWCPNCRYKNVIRAPRQVPPQGDGP